MYISLVQKLTYAKDVLHPERERGVASSVHHAPHQACFIGF